MPLWGAIILFIVFAVNVGLGSFADASFLSDVGEMLLLFAVAILFVIAIFQNALRQGIGTVVSVERGLALQEKTGSLRSAATRPICPVPAAVVLMTAYIPAISTTMLPDIYT